MIGSLRTVVLDCPAPSSLAEFYAGLLGGEINSAESEDDWVVLDVTSGTRLAFQTAPEHRPPEFPDPRGSQQFHLDVRVDDPDAAEREVLALGATRIQGVGDEVDEKFRVFRDPAGHTFCLVWGVED
ncbi:VOC family protein [Mycolicibacterium sediminis]|uniref:Glyoxalase n=1 Tax=Mycolicibacterium sediminis TaxID=1286180 RepID=A0A7I7QTJ0_9MYCO|nr:VOC family protein [Mycolicibacterium sediminis]BBY29545.1 glyoxalase [Mycolicibacterium sediminis]